MTTFDATYDPADNKIRLRASGRLEPELYARVRSAGFIWAPKQELFVAPKWTPEREDLAIELAGELDDEDTSLVDRAEERAERFEGYSEKRGAEAEGARARVDAIADNIPLGQPILVGHHSERRARKDAERIRSGIDKAVKLWQTSKYWTARAAGAPHHAKYKELPAVRARRIKTLEAEQRSEERRRDKAEKFVRLWAGLESATWTKGGKPTTFEERADHLADLDWALLTASKGLTAVEKRDHAIAAHERTRAYSERCIEHLTNRLAYERAMLAESGYAPPPKPKTAADLPLLNYPGTVRTRSRWHAGQIDTYEAHHMTKAELAAIHIDYRGTCVSECGTHRVRTALLPGNGGMGRPLVAVYLTDSKTHARPTEIAKQEAGSKERAALEERMAAKLEQDQTRQRAAAATAPARAATADRDAPFEALKEAAKAGVKVVSAPQLFPTPPQLARRMVELANVQETDRVLEPSAGTGSILHALAPIARRGAEVVAVEINRSLADALEAQRLADSVVNIDFFRMNVMSEKFDRVVMNPPFTHASDVDHIRHAWQFLKPGGRLVALCADGPRQNEILKPWVEELGGTWESLPTGTFASEGTSVRVALLVVDAPAADAVEAA